MVKDLINDLFYFPIVAFKANIWSKLLLTWVGPKPSLAMRLKFFRDTKLKASPKAKLRLLDFDALKDIQNQTSFFHYQEIKENEDYDQLLLDKSWLNLYPHEVTVIKIENSQGEVFTSHIHHGGPYRGASLKSLRTQITGLCFAARKKGLVVEEVQILHTHPSVEAMVEDENESSFIFNGLSKSDIDLGETLAPFVPYPLRVKAITPVANYSMVF